MGNKLFHKLEIILIWIVISIGLYQCCNLDSEKMDRDNVREENKEEQGQKQVEEQQKKKIRDDNIRVLIKTSNFESVYHKELIFSSENGLYIEENNHTKCLEPNKEYMISEKEFQDGNIRIKACQNGRIKIHNIMRTEDVLYRGNMECFGTNDGIVLVNELPVEQYLYGVVPSEMPAAYPQEALKAQAICARTYTYFHMSSFEYPKWSAHVDDSTTFQVYQNVCENEMVNQAVDDTKKQVMMYQGKLIESFYYSTSSGRSSGYEVWNTQEKKQWLQAKTLTIAQKESNSEAEYSCDFAYDRKDDFKVIQEKENAYRLYIDRGNPNDVECQEGWYRWEYTRSFDDIKPFLERIEFLAGKYPDEVSIQGKYRRKGKLTQESDILSLKILQRETSGMVQQLCIQTKNFDIIVKTQQCIREVLAQNGDMIRKKDGSEFALGELLPSAYFYFDTLYQDDCLKNMTIYGGGFGHGAGMSQNGAKCLAKLGMRADDILKYFYCDIELKTIDKGDLY